MCVGQMVSAPGGTGREGREQESTSRSPLMPSSTLPFLWLSRVSVAGGRCALLAVLTWDWHGAELRTHCRLCPQETAVLESCVTGSRTHSLGGATVASRTPLGSMEHGVPGALPPQLEKWGVLRLQHRSQHLSSVKTTGVGGQLRD